MAHKTKSLARLLITCALVSLGTGVSAWATITVDGTDEWSYQAPSVNDDPDEAGISNAYDIDFNYQIFESFTNGTKGLFFIEKTIDDFQAFMQDNAWTGIYLDVTTGGGTVRSRSGVDYYAEWNPVGNTQGQTYTVTLYSWNGSSFVQTANAVQVAWDDVNTGDPYGILEWGFRTDDVGLWSQFGWIGAIDDGSGQGATDYCPDTNWQAGYVPEPGTGVLFLLGLAGVGLLRRRRAG